LDVADVIVKGSKKTKIATIETLGKFEGASIKIGGISISDAQDTDIGTITNSLGTERDLTRLL